MNFFLLLYSGSSEVRFPINIGITGTVATTGEVRIYCYYLFLFMFQNFPKNYFIFELIKRRTFTITINDI